MRIQHTQGEISPSMVERPYSASASLWFRHSLSAIGSKIKRRRNLLSVWKNTRENISHVGNNGKKSLLFVHAAPVRNKILLSYSIIKKRFFLSIMLFLRPVVLSLRPMQCRSAARISNLRDGMGNIQDLKVIQGAAEVGLRWWAWC